MPSSITVTRRVAFSDTDAAGIVHFSYFYRYMEDAEHEFFRSVGLSIMQTREDGAVIGWPRVSAKCSFKSPALFEDVLTIDFRVARIGVKSLTFDVTFTRAEDLIATGTMKTVCCIFPPGGKMESFAIPESYLAVIEEAPAS
ncbi:MAG: thioesterase family protein [Planctomycetota bacterium]